MNVYMCIPPLFNTWTYKKKGFNFEKFTYRNRMNHEVEGFTIKGSSGHFIGVLKRNCHKNWVCGHK